MESTFFESKKLNFTRRSKLDQLESIDLTNETGTKREK